MEESLYLRISCLGQPNFGRVLAGGEGGGDGMVGVDFPLRFTADGTYDARILCNSAKKSNDITNLDLITVLVRPRSQLFVEGTNVGQALLNLLLEQSDCLRIAGNFLTVGLRTTTSRRHFRIGWALQSAQGGERYVSSQGLEGGAGDDPDRSTHSAERAWADWMLLFSSCYSHLVLGSIGCNLLLQLLEAGRRCTRSHAGSAALTPTAVTVTRPDPQRTPDHHQRPR